jgi:S1-C subfamily serine protease
LPDAVASVARSVLGLVRRRHSAAAVVWRPGLAVTSASALWRAPPQVQLVLPDGEAVEGTVRGSDAGTDLAVIGFVGADGVPALGAPAASAVAGAAASAPVEARVGDFVHAVGREPEGHVHASFGHIGAVGGEWRSWRGGRIERLIRLDGGLYPGLAGAAVADAQGRVLGIASPAFSRHHALVLPAATIERVLDALLAHGRVPHSHLGVAVQPVRAMLDGNGIEGLLVSSVAADGPAARGGLLVGDVIVSAGERPTPQLEALRAALAGAAPGSEMALTISRAGQRMTLAVALAEKPVSRCH